MLDMHPKKASPAKVLLSPFGRFIDGMAVRAMFPPGSRAIDFSQPPGEAALLSSDSLSWRIFKNPVSVLIGGITAVILELAEPAVRTGVWEHSSFRKDPLRRLQRTGLAAMMTVYGPRRTAESMIAGVVRRHERIAGTTPDGVAYHASDPELLDWVQATATFGFVTAYSRYASPLSEQEISQAFAEGAQTSRLYGAVNAPASADEWELLLERMLDRLEPSPIILEFLEIMRSRALLPRPLRSLQGLFVRGAVELVPPQIREHIGLKEKYVLRLGDVSLLRLLCAAADNTVLPSSPPAQACRRMGLPEDHLYGR